MNKRSEIIDMKKAMKKEGKTKEEVEEAIAPLLEQLKELKEKAAADKAASEKAALVLEKFAAAVFGDCSPYAGYSDEYINLPEWGIYDTAFWCLKM